MKHIDPNTFVGRELKMQGLTGARLGRTGQARVVRWCDKQPGFGIREYPSGRSVYIVQGNWRGRSETITIGSTAIIDERLALDIARRCLYISEEAPAPADERKRRRAAPMFQDFLADYWKRVSPSWKPSTLRAENEYRLAYLGTTFRDKGIDQITAEDMNAWMAEANRTGASGAANRVLDRLRAVFNKAIEWGHRPEGSNPCDRVRRNPRRKVERFLSPNEFQRLGQALDRHRREWPLHAAALTLLMLTGCRRSEITTLRWREVRSSRIYLEDSKTGARTVQLCRDAAWILGALKRRSPDGYVFDLGNGKPISVDSLWDKVRDDTGLRDVRLQGLRHSYASHAARLALPMPVTQSLLGHSSITSTANYTHFNDEHLFEVANGISALIDAAISGRKR